MADAVLNAQEWAREWTGSENESLIDYERVWVCDSETVAYDNLWVFRHLISGHTLGFHNDNEGIRLFLEEKNPILAGFNIRDYDQHILKANLADLSPEEIKEVNDVIIAGDNVYSYFSDELRIPWIDLPPLIDLFHDIVNRPSLKQLAAFMGMSIEESSVPFDIDRPLTDEEVDEMFTYCEQDVNVTTQLMYLRKDYVENKANLCVLNGVDPLVELKHPNARVAADILQAEWQEYPNEDYELPDTIDVDNIPPVVMDFVGIVDRDIGRQTAKEAEESGVRFGAVFEFHDTAMTLGVGGIHSAVGYTEQKVSKGKEVTVSVSEPYYERATDERAILLQDIGSFYPSMIILHDYMSRSVPPNLKHMFSEFYDLRMEAKAAGDTATADACKLILNTVYGAMKSKYNALADSMQATNVCVTGQLYIIDLLSRILKIATTKLIQSNTDGWMLSVDREYVNDVENIVARWSEETGFTVDTSHLQAIWQRDVNNYLALLEDGSVYVKGGTVGGYYGREKNWSARGFSHTNTIVSKAVVDALVYGRSVRETIEQETDLSRFQIIVRATSRYAGAWGDCHDIYEDPSDMGRRRVPRVLETTKGFQANKVNRIYASTNPKHGRVMKETHRGSLTKFPDTPDHAVIDNKNLGIPLDILDREWYINLAIKKLEAFMGKSEGEIMAETKNADTTKEETKGEETKEMETTTAAKTTRRRTTKPKEEKKATFAERYAEMQALVRESTNKLVPESYIEHISYEYVQTPIYRDILADACQTVGLAYSVDYSDLEYMGVLEHTRGGANTYGMTVKLTLYIRALDTGEVVAHSAYGFGLGSGGNAVSSAHTNAMRNVIINGLLVNTSFDDDVNQANQTTGATTAGYISPDQKEKAKAKVQSDNKNSVTYVQGPAAVDLYERVQDALKLKDLSDKNRAAFEGLIAKYYDENGAPIEEDGHLTLERKVFTAYGNQLDAMGV